MKTNAKAEKIRVLALAILLVAGLLFGGFVTGWRIRGRQESDLPKSDTVTINHTDTCWLPTPPDTITETKPVPVPVPYYIKDTDTIHDSITVILPYEQHYANVDSTLDIWYSGYDAKIDSIVLYRHHTTQIINNSYEKIRYETPRFSINAGISVLKIDKVRGFAGAELTYNAKWSSYSIMGGYCTDFNGQNIPYFGGIITFRFDIK